MHCVCVRGLPDSRISLTSEEPPDTRSSVSGGLQPNDVT